MSVSWARRRAPNRESETGGTGEVGGDNAAGGEYFSSCSHTPHFHGGFGLIPFSTILREHSRHAPFTTSTRD